MGLSNHASSARRATAADIGDTGNRTRSGGRTPRLGLALAGGGFRASIFHAGVLRRMAELDLLRYVQVLSTVSGGSIVGALYVLLLKSRIEAPELAGQGPEQLRLTRDDYVKLTVELEKALIKGIRKNLRTRLLMNPWTIFKVTFWETSLAAEMGRLFERYIFADAVEALRRQSPRGLPAIATIPLTAIRLREAVVGDWGSDNYNATALDLTKDVSRGGPGSAVTSLVLNATSLNSGARFWFSPSEIGDWYLGHFRYDEIDEELLPRKLLRDMPAARRQALLDNWPKQDSTPRPWYQWEEAVDAFVEPWRKKHFTEARVQALKSWWSQDPARYSQAQFVHWSLMQEVAPAKGLLGSLVGRLADAPAAPKTMPTMPLPWEIPAAVDAGAVVGALLRAEPGRLREAKNHAWYLARGYVGQRRVEGGMDRKTRWMLFWEALRAIDDERGERLEEEFHSFKTVSPGDEPPWCDTLLEVALQTYYCQSAAAISPRVRSEWDAFPLTDAVAASAAFPPVFPPYQLHGLYDDLHVQLLSLTDGGAFDNLGVIALLDEHCDHVIVSDTGAEFETKQRTSPVGRLGMMGRLSSMLMNRPTQLSRHELNERRRLGRAAKDTAGSSTTASAWTQFAVARQIESLVSLRIDAPRLDSDARAIPSRHLLSHLRTDLDVFGSVEIECLLNQGYLVADEYIRKGLEGSSFDPSRRAEGAAAAWEPAEAPPFSLNADEVWVTRILEAGRHRFLRALRLRAPLPVTVTLSVVAGLVWYVWKNGITWTHVYRWLSACANWFLDSALHYDWTVELIQNFELRVVVALVALVGALWILLYEPTRRNLWAPLKDGVLNNRVNCVRSLATLSRHARSLKGNLLWLFKLLPLVVLLVPVLATVSHWLFAKPFARYTRDADGLDRPRNDQ